MKKFFAIIWENICLAIRVVRAAICVIFDPPLQGDERRLLQGAGVLCLIGLFGVIVQLYGYFTEKLSPPYLLHCTDLRDGAKYSFRSDYPDQIEGKYQIKPGTYITRHDKIKCLETRIDPVQELREKNKQDANKGPVKSASDGEKITK